MGLDNTRIIETLSEDLPAPVKPPYDFSAEAGLKSRMKSLVADFPPVPYIVRRHLRGWLRWGTAGAVWARHPARSNSVRARSVTSVLNPANAPSAPPKLINPLLPPS